MRIQYTYANKNQTPRITQNKHTNHTLLITRDSPQLTRSINYNSSSTFNPAMSSFNGLSIAII